MISGWYIQLTLTYCNEFPIHWLITRQKIASFHKLWIIKYKLKYYLGDWKITSPAKIFWGASLKENELLSFSLWCYNTGGMYKRLSSHSRNSGIDLWSESYSAFQTAWETAELSKSVISVPWASDRSLPLGIQGKGWGRQFHTQVGGCVQGPVFSWRCSHCSTELHTSLQIPSQLRPISIADGEADSRQVDAGIFYLISLKMRCFALSFRHRGLLFFPAPPIGFQPYILRKLWIILKKCSFVWYRLFRLMIVFSYEFGIVYVIVTYSRV